MKKTGGFTLVEVVVVVAIVALLSAIIVPVVSKQIDDAKIGRAKNEVVVISAAINQFYKDVGLWPARKGSGATDNSLTRLVSGTAVVTIDGTSTGVSYGYTGAGNDTWYDDDLAAAGATGKVDIMDYHLAQNKPENTGGSSYPTSGEFYWKGPYMPSIGKDPWGHYYVCNIDQAYTGTTKLCVVISAGPDGDFDSAADPALGTNPTGDDIWCVVTGRP